TKAQLYARAVVLYRQEQARPPSEQKNGLRKVCDLVKSEYLATIKKPHLDITLNHNTLRNLINGGTSIQDFNATKCWLTLEEIEEVIDATLEFAAWGQPLSHVRLKEHVDAICRARLGKNFPPGGVGDRWTQRFVEKYSDRLQLYRLRSLDTVRSGAVNENVNKTWYDLVEEV
ncbi:hypothetical protein FA15DRAFT_569600, partial [Coprinopsis marcescibilis]